MVHMPHTDLSGVLFCRKPSQYITARLVPLLDYCAGSLLVVRAPT